MNIHSENETILTGIFQNYNLEVHCIKADKIRKQ